MAPDRIGLAMVISPNGLGHYRRAVAIVARLLERGLPVGPLTVVGESWQRDRKARWPATGALLRAGATWVDGVVDPGVVWSADGDLFDDGRLTAWEERLAEVEAVRTADVVLSDNLVGVLAVRADAVLAGSFLWSDVLAAVHPEHPGVAAFVEHERALLAATRPPMVCVGDLVMAGVRERTAAREVGWMCEHTDRASTAARSVAVLGGRTGSADDQLRTAARALLAASRDGGFEVVIDGDLRDVAPGAGIFDYSPGAWRETAVVVCRPGAGTLTECVGWRIPAVALHEADNIELAHNAARVTELGIGVDLGVAPPGDAVVEAVEGVLARSGELRAAIASRSTSGIDEAAEAISSHVGMALRPRAGATAGRDS